MRFEERVRQTKQHQLQVAEEQRRRAQEESAKRERERAKEKQPPYDGPTLKDIWLAVTKALVEQRPTPTTYFHKVDHNGIPIPGVTPDERFRDMWSAKGRERTEARRKAAEESRLQPVWSMGVSLWLFPPPDANGRDLTPAQNNSTYLALNGEIYCVFSGNYYDTPTLKPGEVVLESDSGYMWEMQRDKVRANYELIEQGLANIVAQHDLEINLELE